MAAEGKLGEILVAEGAIDGAQRDAALARQKAGDGRAVGEILVRMGATSEEEVSRGLARQYGLPWVDPTLARVDPALVWRVKRKVAEARLVLPLERGMGGAVRVAVADPRDIDIVRDLQFIFRAQVAPEVAPASRLHQAILRHYSLEHQAHRMLRGLDPTQRAPTTSPTGLDLDADAIQSRLKAGGTQPYVDLLNFLLVNAIERQASDIHLEPQVDDLWVRFRIDGLLKEVLRLPRWTERPLVTRIKVVGKLDFYSHTRPQDGKVTATLGERRIDLRIAVIPSQFGEKVVIRLLDPGLLQTDLGTLGWSGKMLSTWYRMVSQPQGLVLCVGPTGSGKSTTLYSTIQRLRGEATSIITVEDPIEYSLPGMTQIQINERAGMTFATAVRGLLRQDPNVIVIGEVRDRETADAALEASNTGHLVLSSLHTNHAVTTITRLLELGVAPYLLASCLTGIVAQRLVRQVCPECSLPQPPEEEDWQRLGLRPAAMGPLHRRAGPGCPACNYAGYRGRMGVYEVLPISDGLRALIAGSGTDAALWAQARRDGLRTLLDDALDKVAQGLTTLEEVARVVPVDPWRDAPAPAPAEELLHLPDEALSLLPADPPPAPEALPPAAEAPPEAPAAPPRRARLLIADDSDEIRSLVAATLDDDYDLILAKDGFEALELAAAHHPDLLVLDVMMPRLTGFEVCERLRQGQATLPVLFLSARGERTYVKQGFLVGADDYLAKPFDPEELLLRVQALLRRSGQGRALTTSA